MLLRLGLDDATAAISLLIEAGFIDFIRELSVHLPEDWPAPAPPAQARGVVTVVVQAQPAAGGGSVNAPCAAASSFKFNGRRLGGAASRRAQHGRAGQAPGHWHASSLSQRAEWHGRSQVAPSGARRPGVTFDHWPSQSGLQGGYWNPAARSDRAHQIAPSRDPGSKTRFDWNRSVAPQPSSGLEGDPGNHSH